MFYYAIMAARQNNKLNTHTHTNASTKKQKSKKNYTKNTCDVTLLCWWMCPIQPALLFAGWRESTTNHTDTQLQQIFVIPDMTEKKYIIIRSEQLVTKQKLSFMNQVIYRQNITEIL